MNTVHPKVVEYLRNNQHLVEAALIANDDNICEELLTLKEYSMEISLHLVGNCLEQVILYQEGYEPECEEFFTLSNKQLLGAIKGNKRKYNDTYQN